MALGNIVYLETHGPVPVGDLPHAITPPQRFEGLSQFTLHSGRGGAVRFGGRLTPIAYLDGEHAPESVVRALLDANPTLTTVKDHRGLSRLFGKQGRQWKTAASKVLGEYYENSVRRTEHRSEEGTRGCPFCGDEVRKSEFPDHLTGCPEA